MLTRVSLPLHAPAWRGAPAWRVRRPARCAGEAAADRVPVAIFSTSNERAVTAIRDVLLGPEAAGVRVFAGDCVPRKKPDPAIYLLAASELGVDPARWVVPPQLQMQ